jgi:ABC-type multidrug transport system ATPase subunit
MSPIVADAQETGRGGSEEPAPTAILAEGLCKRYGTAGTVSPALRGLSLAVRPGEALALLGPNGAGKTTTIGILATLLRPDAGRALVAGADAVREAPLLRTRIGVALQETGLPRRQSAARLLAYHARLHGLAAGAARERAAELLAAFALEPIAEREISTFSGGERRRLDIALALVREPPVLLLDEPTAGLDLASRRLIWQQLKLRLEAGAALLFSTHDLHEADTQADRIAVVRDGALVVAGTPRELKRRFGSRTATIGFADRELAARAARALGLEPAARGCSLELDPAGDEDVLEALAVLTRSGIPSEEMVVSEPSLETVFDRITSLPAAARAGIVGAP